MYAAIGGGTGVLTIILCGLCVGVVLASVKKWRSWRAHTRQSTYYEASYDDTCGSMMAGPVYETIDPTYKKVPDACQVSNTETAAVEMTDNAAYLMVSKFSQDCDYVYD